MDHQSEVTLIRHLEFFLLLLLLSANQSLANQKPRHLRCVEAAGRLSVHLKRRTSGWQKGHTERLFSLQSFDSWAFFFLCSRIYIYYSSKSQGCVQSLIFRPSPQRNRHVSAKSTKNHKHAHFGRGDAEKARQTQGGESWKRREEEDGKAIV